MTACPSGSCLTMSFSKNIQRKAIKIFTFDQYMIIQYMCVRYEEIIYQYDREGHYEAKGNIEENGNQTIKLEWNHGNTREINRMYKLN
jgi:hypothetical protein